MPEPTDDERALQRLRDEAGAEEAADARARERWLRQQSAEDATVAGTLLDLAEREASVTVHTAAGRDHQGRLDAVGIDFCVLRIAGERAVYLASETITAVRPAPGVRHAAGAPRAAAHDVTLAEVLARLVGDRPDVTVVLTGGQQLAGQLRAVGRDVLTLRLEGQPAGVCYASLRAVTEIVIRAG